MKKTVFFVLSVLVIAMLTRALLVKPVATTWAMYGFWIMCLFVGFVAIEKALKEMGLK